MNKRLTDPAHIDVLIICGGLGTRLRSVEPDAPKGMVVIEGKPFLEILIDHLRHSGFRRFILCTGYGAKRFRQHFEAAKQSEIIFSEEVKPLGTAGAVKQAEKLISSDQQLVLNGDSLCLADWQELLRFHASHQGLATLLVTQDRERTDVGGIKFDHNFGVTQFKEKEKESTPYINAGIYIFERRLLELIPKNQKISLEEQIFPKLNETQLFACVSLATVYDIGTPERLEKFKQLYSAGKFN